MSWLILVIIAALTDSSRIFIDNYTSDVYFKKNGAVSQKLFYGYASIIAAFVIFIITGFSFLEAGLTIVGLVLLTGILSAVAGIPYYKALEIEDSTNLGIFIQLAPVLYLILGWFFLDETFSPLQLIAFAIILAAPILIILTTRKRSRKVKLKAVFYAFLYVLIAVIGNLIFVKANASDINFVSSIALLLLARGVTNLIIVYTRPKWYKRFRTVLTGSHFKLLRPLAASFLFNLAKDFAYRGALIAAPAVALASAASDSAEPIVIFFMGIVLTLIWPKFGREKLTKKSVLVHLIATTLVVAGIILLQF